MKSDQPWSGKLQFDIPRHREYLGFTQDWPRINTLPEWFTVEAIQRYSIADSESGSTITHTGKELREGIKIILNAGAERHFVVQRVRE
jgi:hypothetical protein